MENSQYKVIGTRPLRHDGVDKVTGRANYGADIDMPGMLHGVVLRSPYAHARIRSIDTSAAKALAEISVNRRLADIATAQGHIGHWQIVGPFLNDNRNTGFEKAYGPEEQEDTENFKAEYRWEFGGGEPKDRELELSWGEALAQTAEGDIHVAAHMPVPVRHAVAYARTQLHSDREQTVRLLVDVREKISQRISLNDQMVSELIFQQNELGGTPEERRDGGPRRTKTLKIKLRKGSNKLMVKTSTFGGRWWMALRIMDGKKHEMATGITLALSKPK